MSKKKERKERRERIDGITADLLAGRAVTFAQGVDGMEFAMTAEFAHDAMRESPAKRRKAAQHMAALIVEGGMAL